MPRGALAALDPITGAVRTDFVNNITGGIGTNGELVVQRLKLTHDEGRLLVVHTGRQVNGQDRYGIAIINTRTNKLTPWRTRLCEDNLQFVGGIQRVYGGDVAPDDSYFVVTSGSGGDRPPINDTAIAFDLAGGDNMQPRWISRHFDSVYSVAITEAGVYIGGHFQWAESPTSPQPWPGLDDVGYGTGQGLSGYGLGDAVVKRFHLAALEPRRRHRAGVVRAVELLRGRQVHGGHAARPVRRRRRQHQGQLQRGPRGVLRLPERGRAERHADRDHRPDRGPHRARRRAVSRSPARRTAASGIQRVEVEVMDRVTGRYLADNLTTWGSTTSNTIDATLDPGTGANRTWRLPLTIAGNRELLVRARAVASNGTADNTKATKKFETFGLTDQPPNTTVTGPASPVGALTFTITGIGHRRRRRQRHQLHDAGQPEPLPAGRRDDVGDVPHLPGRARRRGGDQHHVVLRDHGALRERVVRPGPGPGHHRSVRPGHRRPALDRRGERPGAHGLDHPAGADGAAHHRPDRRRSTPGQPLTFAGSATDDGAVREVYVALRNNNTGERLASDGSWGTTVIAGAYRISPVNLNQRSYNWSYTTPFNLSPGTYTFTMGAVDDIGLSTASANQGRLTLNAQIPGDNPPDARLNTTGTITGGQVLSLDLAGTATDDRGVARVMVAIQDDGHQPLPAAERLALRRLHHHRRHDGQSRGRRAPPGPCR